MPYRGVAMNTQQMTDDLSAYVGSQGFRLSAGARSLVFAMEELGKRINASLYHYVVLHVFLREIPSLRSLMLRRNADPDTAIRVLEQDARQDGDNDDKYDEGAPYSETGNRGSVRAVLADYMISAARSHGRSEILPLDLLEGYLDAHDEEYPPTDNASCPDEALHVPFNTLSHIRSRFHPALWISFDDIRRELGLQTADTARKEPVDAAPAHLKPAVLSLLAQHPQYRSNCFLIMPFRETPIHRQIHVTLQRLMTEIGFNLLRADDHSYSDDLLANIEAYMYGCRFAIAVYERVLSDAHNPNVAFEVGYMMGLKKEVCLLKEMSITALPSDLQGRLYVPFDAQDLERSISNKVRDWLRRKNLTMAHEPKQKAPTGQRKRKTAS
jgi:Predicted nucleotide-binding protein containing TIR-like domain